MDNTVHWVDDGKQHNKWFLTENFKDIESDNIALMETVRDEWVFPLAETDYIYAQQSWEIGEEETFHYHLVLHLSRSQRFSFVKTAFPRANIAPCRNYEAALRYASEEDDTCLWVRTYGQLKSTAKMQRSDELAEAKKLIDSGCSEQELYDAFFDLMCSHSGYGLLRYYNSLEVMRARMIMAKQREHEFLAEGGDGL